MAKQIKLTDLVIDALEDIKARDIFMYDVTKITSVFDHIVMACADSTRQTKALARHVMDKAREAGYSVQGIEGEQSGEWVLVDLGDIVIHIMQPAIREYYKLEELWQGGKLEFPRPVVKKVASKVSKEKAVIKNKVVKAKPATEKKAIKKVATKKPVVKKPVVKKSVVKKAIVKKPAVKKPPVITAKTKVAKKPPSSKSSVTKTTPATKPVVRRRKTSAD